MGRQRARPSGAKCDRAQHRRPGHHDSGVDEGEIPGLREVGAFEGATFDPAKWTTTEQVPPFANRLPDDTFWAARQVMAFTDEEIRAIVRTGEVQPGGRGLDHRGARRTTKSHRPHVFRARAAARSLPRDGEYARVRRPRRGSRLHAGTDLFGRVARLRQREERSARQNRDRSCDSLRRASPRRWRLRRGARVRDRRRHARDGVRTAAGERLRRRGTRTRMARKGHRPARAPGTHGAAGRRGPDRAAAGTIQGLQRRLQQDTRQPVHPGGGLRPADHLRADDVLRRHARADSHHADGCEGHFARDGARSCRVNRTHRRTVRGPRRRRAVSAVRQPEAGHT